MDRQRDIHDYATLAVVRRRRGLALQDRLREATDEHRRCLERQSDAETALSAQLEVRDGYARKMRDRTAAGRAVRLDELEGARGHVKALEADCAEAEKTVSDALSSVSRAQDACDGMRRQIAANDARVDSLDKQVKAWRRAASVAAEDREEDERSDSVRVRS